MKDAFYDMKYQINSAGDSLKIPEIGVEMTLVDKFAVELFIWLSQLMSLITQILQ